MVLTFVGLFGDHCEEMEVVGVDDVACFLGGFARGAFKRRFAQGGFEFSADGTPCAEVRRFGAQEEQMFAFVIFNEYKDGDPVCASIADLMHKRGVLRKYYASRRV